MNMMKMKQEWKNVLKAASKHLPSAKKDLGNTTVLNDASWLGSSVARERFHDDRYDCLFRQSRSVDTRGCTHIHVLGDSAQMLGFSCLNGPTENILRGWINCKVTHPDVDIVSVLRPSENVLSWPASHLRVGSYTKQSDLMTSCTSKDIPLALPWERTLRLDSDVRFLIGIRRVFMSNLPRNNCQTSPIQLFIWVWAPVDSNGRQEHEIKIVSHDDCLKNKVLRR
uniref:Avr9 elicitor response protein n=1 Tax=Tanacetum cinerariifolium TaxID=118510 RepID=A0A6L2KMR2_TANCI|nr:Avr9 elicitor response protein [Tanacetum cinerariifolium]